MFFPYQWVNIGPVLMCLHCEILVVCIFHHSSDRHGTVRTRTMKTNEDEAALCCTSTP